MATIEEPPAARAAVRLRRETTALRLSFHWLGTRKSLSRSQRSEAARPFAAAGDFLSAGKKLLDTTHPRFRQVTAVRHRAQAYVQGMSLPYPEPGIRLIRRDDLDEIQDRLTELEQELSEQAAKLDEAYAELQASARQQLGRLFASSDYPASLKEEFGMCWEFPSVDPPDYLRRLSPALYREEAARVAARFDDAARLAEADVSRGAERSGQSLERAAQRPGRRQAQDLPRLGRRESQRVLPAVSPAACRGRGSARRDRQSRRGGARWASTLSSCATPRVSGSASSTTWRRSARPLTSSWSTSLDAERDASSVTFTSRQSSLALQFCPRSISHLRRPRCSNA
jgi:hypothetical protein